MSCQSSGWTGHSKLISAHVGADTVVAQPTRIGSYEIIRPLGKGGMGAVYLGRDPAIDRLVAIKLLGEGLDSPESRERFLREARAAGRLRHPNIVMIFHVGEH